MSSQKPLKVGFVGLSANGWASKGLAPALTLPSMRDYTDIVAVCTTSAGSATASADAQSKVVGHAVKPYYGPNGPEEMAKDPDVDFVAAAVRPLQDKSTLLPIIEAGKGFFAEWPVGTSLEECVEIASKAKEKGVRSIIGLQGRQSRMAQKIRETLKSGKIGTVRSTSISFTVGSEPVLWAPFAHEKYEFYKKSKGLTIISTLAGHALDILVSVLGEFATVHTTPSFVYPTITLLNEDGTPNGKTTPVEIPDHYVIAGTLKSGVIVNVFIKMGYKPTPTRRTFQWEIDGEEGTIRAQSAQAAGPMGAQIMIVDPDLYINDEKVNFQVKEGEPTGALYNISTAWKAFVEGKESGYETYPTIEDAVKNHRLIAAIEESGATGNTVILD